MKIRFTALLLLAVFVLGCKKEKMISGRVYNLVTGDGIVDSKVTIFEKVKKGQFHGDPIELFTDSDGRFSYDGKYRASKAQGIVFENYHDSIRYYVAEPRQQKIMNGEGNVQYDLPLARLVPITLFFTDENGEPKLGQNEPVRFRMRSFHTDGYYPKSDISFYTPGIGFSVFNTNASVSFLAMEGWNHVSTYTEDDGMFETNVNEVYSSDSIYVNVNGPITQSFIIQIAD